MNNIDFIQAQNYSPKFSGCTSFSNVANEFEMSAANNYLNVTKGCSLGYESREKCSVTHFLSFAYLARRKYRDVRDACDKCRFFHRSHSNWMLMKRAISKYEAVRWNADGGTADRGEEAR